MRKLLFGAALGAAAAWFLDPGDGARRRHVTRDKAMKYVRRGKAEAARQATYAGQTTKGKVAAAVPDPTKGPAEERLNDPALQAKVESEIFRDPDAPKGQVSVNVENGVVYLRGEVGDTETIERLRTQTAQVDGVRDVQVLLHTPGEPAPTKT